MYKKVRYRRKIAGIFCAVIASVGLIGCGNKGSENKEKNTVQSERKENRTMEEKNQVGQGFVPPKDSHIDKNGHIVDKEGNTFRQDGSWEVPEGGHVDEKGRIIDRNGNVMGGGAPVGSKG